MGMDLFICLGSVQFWLFQLLPQWSHGSSLVMEENR